MRSYKAIAVFGFIIWGIPLVIATFILSVRQNERILYESIMPVVLTVVSVICAILYFRYVKSNYTKEGFIFGCLALVIDTCLDLLLFMWGPMKMTIIEYMKDIGLTNLIVPVVSLGIGKAFQQGSDRNINHGDQE